MKRGLLIAAGTLGGLGAVMAITPPQLTATNSLALSGAGAIGAPTATPATATPPTATPPTAASTVSATATKSVTTKAVPTKKAKAPSKVTAAKSTTATNSNSGSTTAVTATDPTAAAPAKGVTGSFVGPSVFVQYGDVQVQITVVDGRITDATALVAPSGKNDRYTHMAVPILKKQTLAAQSANIQGASGASYTSYGWYKSLQGALAKAGL